jgi:carbamate kinase
MPQTKKTLLVALGGNALIRKGQDGTVEQQFDNLKIPMSQMAKLSQKYRLIITHGNGPQVGNLLLQQECCEAVPRLPLEILVAQTQGQIGYMIESTLDSELTALGVDEVQPLITVITYVVVDEKDPSFRDPSKPIGPVFTERHVKGLPYPTRETAKGYRRLVVSPSPVTIVEKREISRLISMDFIVICCGGGGIPVVREGRRFCGVDAVIDKDLASAKLAEEVGVDIFVIATDEKGVALNYGMADQAFLPTVTVSQARDYLKNGEFPPGSMGPKVQACMSFIANGGEKAVITHLEDIDKAVEGNAGTHVIAG